MNGEKKNRNKNGMLTLCVFPIYYSTRVSFVLTRFVISELLSEVDGWVGHGLVLAWFESCVLRLVFLDSSLESPGQEKRVGILFIPLRVVVREIQLSLET